MAEVAQSGRTMVAVEAVRAGGPEVLRVSSAIAVPVPGKGEVRVRIAAASVNPIDVRRRGGHGRRVFSLIGAAKFPLVLGNDFAGVVDAVGRGVDQWRPGQRVFGCKAASRLGTHAQFAVVPAAQLLATPDTLDDAEAASLPYAFVTAWRAVTDGLDCRREDLHGRSVLVHGGAGAVGSTAVRLLVRRGARVTISGRRADPQCAEALGADGTLDLRESAAPRAVPGFDAIVNCAAYEDEPALLRLLRPDSIGLASVVHPLLALLDSHGWVSGALAATREWRKHAALVRATGGRHYRWVVFKPDSAAMLELAAMLQSGALGAAVGAVIPLERAAEAHARVERGGAAGKTVLAIPQ